MKTIVGYIAVHNPMTWNGEELVVGDAWFPVRTYGGTSKLYTTEGRAKAAVSGVTGALVLPVYVEMPQVEGAQ